MWWIDVPHERLFETPWMDKVPVGTLLLVVDYFEDELFEDKMVLFRLGGGRVRGKKSTVGNTRVAANGYHYTRTECGWQLTHRLLLERSLGRELGKNERVRFLDGDRTNLDAKNLEVYKVKPKTASAKRALLEAKIEDLKAELDELLDEATQS